MCIDFFKISSSMINHNNKKKYVVLCCRNWLPEKTITGRHSKIWPSYLTFFIVFIKVYGMGDIKTIAVTIYVQGRLCCGRRLKEVLLQVSIFHFKPTTFRLCNHLSLNS